MKLGAILMGLLFLISCSDLKKGAQLHKISELQIRLDEISKAWNPMEITEIDSLELICSHTIDSLELHYQEQKVEQDLALMLDKYKQSTASLREIQKIHRFFPVLLSDKSKALIELKKDVESGTGRREKYDEYIAFENKEIATLNEQFERYLELKSRSWEQYDESNEKVTAFLNELRAEPN